MKILNLFKKSPDYSSNVYLVTGTWNTLEDVNTLVDVGRDKEILKRLLDASTGVGKKRVEQVVLTHSHFDHVSLLTVIVEMFHPRVYAASPFMECVDTILRGGEHLRMGDRDFEVIRTPEHSNDSICFYCEEEGILFVGDTPLLIRAPGGSYSEEFIQVLERFCRKDIRAIYFGHGEPLLDNCNKMLRTSLDNARQSK
jgi:glyoxylase-like metal-dependent hydrolase (beta-lactamase superfamily II)